jgi:hypothetical protein
MTKPPKYPEIMPLLETSEVEHGIYGTACGTKHCAVGHVAVAFGLAAEPSGDRVDRRSGTLIDTGLGWDLDGCGGLETVAPIGSPMHKFARRFAINLGAEAEAFDQHYAEVGLRALEDVFEQGLLLNGDDRPNRKKTAEAFNAAVRESGYTKVVDR